MFLLPLYCFFRGRFGASKNIKKMIEKRLNFSTDFHYLFGCLLGVLGLPKKHLKSPPKSYKKYKDFYIDFGPIFGAPWSSKIIEKQRQPKKLKLQRRLDESSILTSRAASNPFKKQTRFPSQFYLLFWTPF